MQSLSDSVGTETATAIRNLIDNFVLNDNAFWIPLPGPQMMAYISQADELYYGGQAGGGKTDLLLGVAATSHERSIIFRRTYPQLEAIWSRGIRMMRGVFRWNGQAKTFFSPSDERLIQLGAMQYDADKDNYQGRPYDLFGFDELPQFLYSQYSFVIGWNRTTKPGQRCRVIGAGNPPTNEEGVWVIDYWAPWLDPKYPNPAAPGELRWFIIDNQKSIEVPDNSPIEIGGEMFLPSSRTFIPAALDDNPHLRDSNYRRRLQGLPEPLRSQLLYGDFTLLMQDDQWQIIPTEWVLAAMELWKVTNIRQVVDDNGNVKNAEMTIAGIDVARGGKDRTIIAPRYINYIDTLIDLPGRSTPDGQAVAGEVIKVIKNKKTKINIDVIGVGSSAYDYISDYGYNVVGINSAEGSDATDQTGMLTFINLRAEMWWNARELLDPANGHDIALPDDRELLRELTTPRWKVMSSGIKVESKEELIKRVGRSPDKADAVIMALYDRNRVGIV